MNSGAMHVNREYSSLAGYIALKDYKRLLIMVLTVQCFCGIMRCDLRVISDLHEAYTKKQRCASVSYDANELFINGQPSSASCQITHCDRVVVV
jgi:hypothetical protein